MAIDSTHICGICEDWLEWRLNEKIDDFAWWCPACEEWIDEKEAVRVMGPGAQG